MPDFKIKLDRLLNDAADFQLLGSLAADAGKRAEYRARAERFRALAQQVREQVTSRPTADIEFLFEQAGRCRTLAADISDTDLQSDLLSLAAELEQKARQERGDS